MSLIACPFLTIKKQHNFAKKKKRKKSAHYPIWFALKSFKFELFASSVLIGQGNKTLIAAQKIAIISKALTARTHECSSVWIEGGKREEKTKNKKNNQNPCQTNLGWKQSHPMMTARGDYAMLGLSQCLINA